MNKGLHILCLGLLLASAATAQDAPADAGSIAFAPTGTTSTASAPNPSASVRMRTGNYANDSLAATPTSYNQIQTIGVRNSAHIAPISDITTYLTTVNSTNLTSMYVPQNSQFTQVELYNQLEDFGARQFHFKIYYDPTGMLYQTHAGLKIVNQSANTSAVDPKWGYPGWKIMNEPNFDFNTSCTTLVTCLFNIKNWLLTTPGSNPITIYLEPTIYTYTQGGSNATFASALSSSTVDGPPTTLAEPLNPATFEVPDQAWRDLENEVLNIYDRNEYITIVTPDLVMGDEDTLSDAVLKNGYTLYPALKDLNNKLLFVLTGDFVNSYLDFYPDLKNATLFVAEPYNAQSNYTDSTLFVDFVGQLSGVNYTTNLSSSAVTSAVSSQVQAINNAVKAGYMVRASADWNTYEARNNASARATAILASGAHFVETTFPTTPTLFPSTYSIALPIRGNQKQAVRCNPVTSGGGIFNATSLYTVGCPAASMSPSQAPVAATSL